MCRIESMYPTRTKIIISVRFQRMQWRKMHLFHNFFSTIYFQSTFSIYSWVIWTVSIICVNIFFHFSAVVFEGLKVVVRRTVAKLALSPCTHFTLQFNWLCVRIQKTVTVTLSRYSQFGSYCGRPNILEIQRWFADSVVWDFHQLYFLQLSFSPCFFLRYYGSIIPFYSLFLFPSMLY